MLNRSDKYARPTATGFALLLSVVVVLVVSFHTSFLYENTPSVDSAMFQLIGKAWTEGRLPYLEMWDSKGPLVYFVNAVGFWITGNRYGISVIQVVFLFISILLIINLLRKEFSFGRAIVLTFVAILTLVLSYFGGNTVQEYLLPLLLWCLTQVYQWAHGVGDMRKSMAHPPRYAFVYGMTLAVCLFSALINAIGVCAAVLVIIVCLVRNRLWSNLWRNAVAFMAGFVVVTALVVIYFLCNNALEEMWYATFLFNLEYTETSGFDLFSWRGLMKVFMRDANCYILLAVAIWLLLRGKSKLRGWLWLMVSALTFLWLLKGRGFSQYATVALPYICLAFNELGALYKSSGRKVKMRVVSRFACVIALYGIVGCAYSVWLYRTMYAEDDTLKPQREFLHAQAPEGFEKSFVAYNCCPALYLYEDISPCYRHFTLQDASVGCGKSLYPRLRKVFEEGNAEYILVAGKPMAVADILSRRYELLARDRKHHLVLLKLKDSERK